MSCQEDRRPETGDWRTESQKPEARSQQGQDRNPKTEVRTGERLSTDERLLKLLLASAEQQAAIDRILAGKLEPAPLALPPVAPEAYISKDEVARRLNKKRRTIDEWMQKGILVHVRVGRSVLFRWSDVQKHLEENYQICRMGRKGYGKR